MTPATTATAPLRTQTGSLPTHTTEPSIEILGRMGPRYAEILTPEAVAFLTELHQRFGSRRHDRLADRMRRRFEIGNGHDPRFRDDTAHIREDAEWRVAGAGPGLEDRRVEITGPTDPKMTINALNSGARVWLADQEDATSPTWKNVIGGSCRCATRSAAICRSRTRRARPTRSRPSARRRS
jgi:malate synthase